MGEIIDVITIKDILYIIAIPLALSIGTKFLITKLANTKRGAWISATLISIVTLFFFVFTYIQILEAKKQTGLAATTRELAEKNAMETEKQKLMAEESLRIAEQLQAQLDDCRKNN